MSAVLHYRIAYPTKVGVYLPITESVRDPSRARFILPMTDFHRKDKPLSDEELSRFNNRVKFYARPPEGPSDFLSAPKSAEFLVSDRIRSTVEELEPGLHQFIPMELVAPNAWKRLLVDTQYYWLNCCTRLEAIDISRSELVSPVPGSVSLGRPTDDATIAVKASVVRQHHLWMSVRPIASGDVFVSESLAEKWRAMDAGPIELLPCIMV
ncbi:MAG: DUF1629 domain-containing protein [Hyphomicrobiaceae bacterium]